MNISQMHVFFRQFAQQMGMQNVRAILPEQIDLLINTSISDTINQLIRENVGIKNDRIITDSSKIGTVNALRTLYKVSILPLATSNPALGFRVKNSRTGKMSTEDATKPTPFPNTLFYVDFSINYKTTTTGYNGTDDTAPLFAQDALETTLFPVRIIDDIFLADSLNDFILKNRLRSPIIVTHSNGIFDLYIDKFTKKDSSYYTLENNLVPYQLRVSYIEKPAIVKYSEDLNGVNVDCNLPEFMHEDILKHAVDLYHAALQGSIIADQAKQVQQQREDYRNGQRPQQTDNQN